MLEGILLFFLITNFIRRERILNRIYFLLILGWGIAIILGFVQYFGGILGNERSQTRMFSMFDNPNLFGGYLILLFPFAIFYGIRKSFLKKIPLTIFIIFSILALILSRSKDSWIAFVITLFFMGIFSTISYMKKCNLRSPTKIFDWKWIIVSIL
jgi:hypothetical protein